MLLAYLDEVGQVGAYVSPTHPKYNGSPEFGYGGFIIPAEKAREFGAIFTKEKRRLCAREIESFSGDVANFEKKGSELLEARAPEESPQNIRVLAHLISTLDKMGGSLFYYLDEKPVGTPKETNVGKAEYVKREVAALRETMNRLATYADKQDEYILIMMDAINEKTRLERLRQMYAHILGRAVDHAEMRRIIEPPMHIDSTLSSNVQFADWVAALVFRAADYQFNRESRYGWVVEGVLGDVVFKKFTYESKLHFWQRAVDDILHSRLFDRKRILYGNITPFQQADNFAKLEAVRRSVSR